MSNYYIGDIPFDSDYLEHFGILGMKWYKRRFQNKDGSYTPEGRERYGIGKARTDSSGTDDSLSTNEKEKSDPLAGQRWGARRYQNPDGSLTPEGQKPSESEGTDDTPKQETEQERKERILKTGTAEDVLSLAGTLNNQEMQQAIQRLQNEKTLRNLAEQDRQQNQPKTQEPQKKKRDLLGTMTKVSTVLGTAATLYTNYDRIKTIASKIRGKKEPPSPAQSYAQMVLAKFASDAAKNDKNLKDGELGWFPDVNEMQVLNQKLTLYKSIENIAKGNAGGGKGGKGDKA